MRTLRIDFTAENYLPDGDIIGRMGEHNATDIIITPTAEMSQCDEIENYVAAVVTDGRVIRSDFYPKGETITVPLCAQLTQDHSLGVQLEGYDGAGALVVKSPMVTELRLLPSAGGDEVDYDGESGGVVSQINLNTLARHDHENSKILDGLSENGGNLTYKGVSVSARKTKSEIFDIDHGIFSASVDGNVMSLFLFEFPFDNPTVKLGSEIVSVEVYDELKRAWIDLRNMIEYDPLNPYYLVGNRIFYKEDEGVVYIAVVAFTRMLNSIAENAIHGALSKVKVTVYDDGEE